MSCNLGTFREKKVIYLMYIYINFFTALALYCVIKTVIIFITQNLKLFLKGYPACARLQNKYTLTHQKPFFCFRLQFQNRVFYILDRLRSDFFYYYHTITIIRLKLFTKA